MVGVGGNDVDVIDAGCVDAGGVVGNDGDVIDAGCVDAVAVGADGGASCADTDASCGVVDAGKTAGAGMARQQGWGLRRRPMPYSSG